MFKFVEYLHILSVIAAVGSNITYGFWISRAQKNPEFLPFTLRSVKLIDNQVANPAYGFILVTGLLMAFLKPFDLTTPWLLTSIILYVIAAAAGIFIYAPISRRQMRILEQEGFESENFSRLYKRGRALGLTVLVITLVILYLMIAKPALWGPPVEETSWIKNAIASFMA